jgi:hypothetical protein
MTSTSALPRDRGPGIEHSPFRGADICAEAGFQLPSGAIRPMFEHHVWDFTAVAGLAASKQAAIRRLDFTPITDPRWRLVAKELIFALLVPRHDIVILLPRALRTALHLESCRSRLREMSRLLHWLTDRGIPSLQDVNAEHCQQYLSHRSHTYADDGEVRGDLGSSTRRMAVQVILDLINYRDLFTADRVRGDLLPWGTQSSSAIADAQAGWRQNKTPPVDQEVLQPMLSAALYLAGTLGPHVVALTQQSQAALRTRRQLPKPRRCPAERFTAVLGDHVRDGIPLPQLAVQFAHERLTAGWASGDPILPVSLTMLAAEAGVRDFPRAWLQDLRPAIEDALGQVGTSPAWGQQAAEVPAATGERQLPWTSPLHHREVIALSEVVRTATLLVTATVSGMRSSELMELKVGCRRLAGHFTSGLFRYRLAGTLVKGQPLGGTDEEWVVIEPVYRAVEVAEQLHGNPRNGALLFGPFNFRTRYGSFREWVNGPAGQRLGLPCIPDRPVSPRALRRTLAIELAYRPNGVLASKIALKHVSVVTSEGYAARPGGAQARLLAEVSKHETEHKLAVALQEFRNYQAGILPAGPGAAELTGFFARIDHLPAPTTSSDAADTRAAKVHRSDRDILNLLSKRAATLHLGAAANYCWFTDPSRALCLKLAGTPDAKAPLAGLCDSARCPQATHHAVHRPVWAEHARNTATFLGGLGPTRKTEKARLQDDYDRAIRVIAGIDAATGTGDEQNLPCG